MRRQSQGNVSRPARLHPIGKGFICDLAPLIRDPFGQYLGLAPTSEPSAFGCIQHLRGHGDEAAIFRRVSLVNIYALQRKRRVPSVRDCPITEGFIRMKPLRTNCDAPAAIVGIPFAFWIVTACLQTAPTIVKIGTAAIVNPVPGSDHFPEQASAGSAIAIGEILLQNQAFLSAVAADLAEDQSMSFSVGYKDSRRNDDQAAKALPSVYDKAFISRFHRIIIRNFHSKLPETTTQ